MGSVIQCKIRSKNITELSVKIPTNKLLHILGLIKKKYFKHNKRRHSITFLKYGCAYNWNTKYSSSQCTLGKPSWARNEYMFI